jgi:predicted transcriptional regulator
VATTTVATMLKVMLEKGLVVRKQGERGYLWSAKVTREAAESGLTHKLIDRLFDGSARRLVAHLIEQGKLSAADRLEIQELLSQTSRRQETKLPNLKKKRIF